MVLNLNSFTSCKSFYFSFPKISKAVSVCACCRYLNVWIKTSPFILSWTYFKWDLNFLDEWQIFSFNQFHYNIATLCSLIGHKLTSAYVPFLQCQICYPIARLNSITAKIISIMNLRNFVSFLLIYVQLFALSSSFIK